MPRQANSMMKSKMRSEPHTKRIMSSTPFSALALSCRKTATAIPLTGWKTPFSGSRWTMSKALPWPWNKILAPPSEKKEGGVVSFPDAARSRHAIVFGGTGVGKSRFLEALALQDILQRVTCHSTRGVAVIDPHGDMIRNLRARLAILAQHFPQLNDLLVIIDPSQPRWTVRFNPLELQPGEVPERKADSLANLVTTIYHEEPTKVVRMYRVSYHAFLALILAGKNLPDINRFLTDRTYRDEIVESLNHPEVTRYFFHEFPQWSQGEREAHEIVESTLNRLGRFSADPDLSATF